MAGRSVSRQGKREKPGKNCGDTDVQGALSVSRQRKRWMDAAGGGAAKRTAGAAKRAADDGRRVQLQAVTYTAEEVGGLAVVAGVGRQLEGVEPVGNLDGKILGQAGFDAVEPAADFRCRKLAA